MTNTTESISITAGALLFIGGLGYLVKSNWEQKSSPSYSYQQMHQYGGKRNLRHTRKRRT
jgi:hypothetical protein